MIPAIITDGQQVQYYTVDSKQVDYIKMTKYEDNYYVIVWALGDMYTIRRSGKDEAENTVDYLEMAKKEGRVFLLDKRVTGCGAEDING